MNDIIAGYEERLRLAMISGDIEEADQLFADSLIFVNHLGQLISKDDDLSAQKQAQEQGNFKMTKINIAKQNIRVIDNVAIVISDAEVDVVINNEKITDHLIYTRIWQKFTSEWKLVGGQATRVL